jgi:hypothetical protein
MEQWLWKPAACSANRSTSVWRSKRSSRLHSGLRSSTDGAPIRRPSADSQRRRTDARVVDKARGGKAHRPHTSRLLFVLYAMPDLEPTNLYTAGHLPGPEFTVVIPTIRSLILRPLSVVQPPTEEKSAPQTHAELRRIGNSLGSGDGSRVALPWSEQPRTIASPVFG